MKRFSAREFALLTLPLTIVAGAAWWAVRRPPVTGFEVAQAQRIVPVPIAVYRGANAAAEVKLKERNRDPNDNTGTNWQLDLRVRAGDHLLWDSAQGGGQRQILVHSTMRDDAFYGWTGAFDLKRVPAEWGDVTLDWDAKLAQAHPSWRGSWNDHFQRHGRLVLQSAGANLPVPVVSRAPHIRLIRSCIEALPASDGGKNCRLTLTFQSDVAAGSVTRVESDIAFHDADGAQFSSTSSVRSTPLTPKTKQGQYEIVEYLGPPWHIRARTAKWTVQAGNSWPLRGSLAVADAKSRALLGEQNY